MGWLFMPGTGRFATPRAYLDDQFTYVRDDHCLTVRKSSMVGSTYYAAAEETQPGKPPQVFAIVCLTRSRPGDRDGMTFGYKDMTEHMGPCEAECPAGILDLLTPTDSQYANDWRARCRAHLNERRLRNAKPTPKVGQLILFDEVLRFSDGIARARFEVVAGPSGKGLRYRDPVTGQICKIPAVKKRAYRLVNIAVTVTRRAA